MRREIMGMALGLSAPFFLSAVALAAQAPSTEEFVRNVAISDMFEIESGRLADEKAQNDDVQSFGDQMVDDHSKTSEELKELVQTKNIKAELPAKLDDQHQAKLKQLQGLSGNQFDKSYIKMQVEAHEKAVALFEAYAAGGENSDLKEWAEDTLPALKEHLEEAKDLNENVAQKAEAKTNREAKETNQGATSDHKTMGMADEEAKTRQPPKNKIEYITRQAPTDWTAEALIGRTVENAEGDNLGEINNVIINEKGNVVAVVIGVGGFLGIGEKNVGVPFDNLDFRTAEAMEDNADNRDDDRARDDTADRNNDTANAERETDSAAARFDTEHENIHIVLNTTKEDLEAAPAFAWLEEQDSRSSRGE